MYSMLIVDDEEITRKGLRSLPIWASLGIRVVACAGDGEEALALLERLPVHILLTDVKMPCMDGLLLAERVREQYPHIRIVFVSGYDDVSYIRRALRMSAVDYILKPVEPSELSQCFRRVVDGLDREKNRQGELQQLLDAYKVGMTFMQENLLGILLTSETVPEEKLWQVAEVLQTRHGDYRYWVAVLRVHFQDGISMHERMNPIEGAYCFPIDQSAGVYALLFASALPQSAAERHAALAALRDRFYEQGARRFFAVYADKPGGVWEIRKMYKRTMTALPLCFSRPDGSILAWEHAPQPAPGAAQVPEISADGLEHLFLTGGEEDALRFLDDCFDGLRNAGLTCAAEYIPLFSPLLRALDDVLARRFAVREDDGMDFSQQLGMLANAFCLDDMFDIVRRHYLGVCSMLLYHSTGETPARIAKVKRYIQKHYAKAISIESIAREVSLAPTYLCLLFREETGQTLNAYITHVRMEHARMLLADEKLKLYDVSQAVGYPNASYFTRQFRKHTGMTPTEYRSRRMKGE